MKAIILIILSTITLNAQSGWWWAYSSDAVTVDTVSTTLDIDKDFELAEMITNGGFDSDVSSWSAGAGAGLHHYGSDWNTIGRVNVLQDSAVATSNAYATQTGLSFVGDRFYKLSYDYYMPSGNTTCVRTNASLVGGTGFTTSGVGATLDSWDTHTTTFTANTGNSGLRIYQRNSGSANVTTVGDLLYNDNVSITEFSNFSSNGNHTYDSTSASPITGTYSGKITASGAGDASTNFSSLGTALFSTLTAGNNAYISFNALANTAGVNVTMVIGGKSNTWEGVDNSSAELLTWEFKVTAAEVGQDIQIYLNKAANIIIDDFGN